MMPRKLTRRNIAILMFVALGVVFFLPIVRSVNLGSISETWSLEQVQLLVIVILTIIAFGSGIGSVLLHWKAVGGLSKGWFSGWLQGLSTEMVGAILTAVVLGSILSSAQQRAAEAPLRQSLIEKLNSGDVTTTLSAIAELRGNGWLSDGTLKGIGLYKASFSGANIAGANLQEAQIFGVDFSNTYLEQADFSKATIMGSSFRGLYVPGVNFEGAGISSTDFSNTDLRMASFRNTQLMGVNLEGATIEEVQMVLCRGLLRSTMPDGKRYDGRYMLPQDIWNAEYLGIDTEDPKAMADFYEVPLTRYQEGQAWALENLSRLRKEGEDWYENWNPNCCG